MKSLAIVLFALLACRAVAQDVQVALLPSTTVATVGEHIELRVVAQAPLAAETLELALHAGDFDNLGEKNALRRPQGDHVSLEKTITIAFFKTGDFQVGPLEVQVKAGQALLAKKELAAVAVKIKSVLEEKDTDILPLKRPFGLSGSPMYALRYVLIMALLLAAGWAVFYFVQNRRKAPAASTQVALNPAAELLVRLRTIIAADYHRRGEYKHLFIALAGMLKHFAMRNYAFNAEDLTTAEMLAAWDLHESDPDLARSVKILLETADLVKFAQYTPRTDEIQYLFTELLSLAAVYQRRQLPPEDPTHAATGT
jgi:hypothetical protein